MRKNFEFFEKVKFKLVQESVKVIIKNWKVF